MSGRYDCAGVIRDVRSSLRCTRACGLYAYATVVGVGEVGEGDGEVRREAWRCGEVAVFSVSVASQLEFLACQDLGIILCVLLMAGPMDFEPMDF